MASPNTTRGTVVRMVGSTVLWFLLLVNLVYFVPKQRKVFDEFGMKVPIATTLVFDVSMWFADYWWIVLPFAGLVVMVAGVVTYFVRQKSGSWVLSALWTLFLIGVPLMFHLIVGFSLFLARSKLEEGLRR